MLHKILIVVLFFGVLVSLSSGLYYLLKDFSRSESLRLRHALIIRIVLTSLLLLVIFHGFYTGALTTSAPWDSQLHTSNN